MSITDALEQYEMERWSDYNHEYRDEDGEWIEEEQ